MTNKSSWKTSLSGLAAALGTALTQIEDPAWLKLAGSILMAVSVYLLGKNARDRDVSSEDEGLA
jgi:hypothetical protein